jgi:hypothetical protein
VCLAGPDGLGSPLIVRLKNGKMKNKSALAWGITFSMLFGLFAIAAIIAVSGNKDSGLLDTILVVLFWPATQVLMLIGWVFPDTSIRQFGPPLYICYMLILGFFIGFYLNKLYLRMTKHRLL